MDEQLIQFINCRILRDHILVKDDLWVRNGKIVNPEQVFFDERRSSDVQIDCHGCIIAPGFIEAQINGAFGIDFSNLGENYEQEILTISKGLLQHGVTSYCPTMVTSPVEVYHKIIKNIQRHPGGKHGATVLGLHLEGPFINVEKKGAHPPHCIKELSNGFKTLMDTYGSIDNVSLITLAPELPNALEVIKELTARGIVTSVGHSMSNLLEGEAAVKEGASLITHLFNAMLPFHHRDPGLVGLLQSHNIPAGRTIYFGIIPDGIHTHPAALRIAYKAHPEGLVIVTDAISAMGLQEGTHNIGQFLIDIKNGRACIAGTETLCGSIATMNECVQKFHRETACTKEFALEAASLHPAKALGISDRKGCLDFGCDADLVFVDDELNLISTWIAGECVYKV